MPQTSQAKEATQSARKTAPAKPAPQSVRPSGEAMGPLFLEAALTNPLSASPQAILQLQRHYGNRAVQRLIRHAQADVQREAPIGLEGGAVGGDLQGQIDSARGGGRPLDRTVGSQIGGALGADFSGVHVHTGPSADGLNRSLSARAFTTGSDIFFSQGAYNPGTHSGKQLLAHELTHVVQQGGAAAGQRKPNKIQAKLTVGPAGDKYEEEADQVAGQVMRQTARGAPTRPVRVQRVAISRRPAGIQRAFQDRAAAFEQSLGVYAFHHPAANQAAEAMSNKVRDYIERKASAEGATEKSIDKLWQKAGEDRAGMAGAVGQNVADIKKVFAKGNLRERMTHVYNFMSHQFGGATAENLGGLDELAGDSKALQQGFDQTAKTAPEGSEAYFEDVLHKAAPRQTALAEQKQTREASREDPTSKRTVGEVGWQKTGGLLSKREARFMLGQVDDKESIKDKTLQWSEGARVWKMRKQHWWVQQMESLDLPLMAGPSAHTNAFLNIAKLLGIKDLWPVRLAAIGQLLPIRAHSLVEILESAQGHGLNYTPGPEMYKSVRPLKQRELRQAVGKGQFPDEVGGEVTGVGSDYGKLLNKYRGYMKFVRESGGEPEPQADLKHLEDLDQTALAHITKKQKEKSKLKGDSQEITRLEGRIRGVTELREELQPKLAKARTKVNLAFSRKRVDQLTGGGKLNKQLFHGTHTGLLKGLGGSGGLLMSGAELEKRGIVRSSGEGDFFTSGENKGPKEFISVGLGEFGLGTALAYAQAAGNLANYNIERYTDAELALELQQLTEAIQNYDEGLLSKLRKGEREHKTKKQLEGLFERLEGERKYRETLPKDHPRRGGQLSAESNYPLLFELDPSGLDVRDEGGKTGSEKPILDLAPNERRGVYKEFLGERMVYNDTIDLKLKLVRVYCPADKMDEVQAKLAKIVGHSKFEVLAIEALQELPQEGLTGGTLLETYATLNEFEDIRKQTVAAYAQGMLAKEPIDNIRAMAKKYGSTPPKQTMHGEPTKKIGGPMTTEVKGPSSTGELSEEKKAPALTPLQQALQTDNLSFHGIAGDGNCLFAAVLHQLGQTGAGYANTQSLRNGLAEHMLGTSPDYQQTILKPIFEVEGLTIQTAARRIMTPGYWQGLVGDIAPQLLADLLERPIHIYRATGKQTLNPRGASHGGPIAIVYDGLGHYDSTSPAQPARGGLPNPVVTKIDEQGSPPPVKPLSTVSGLVSPDSEAPKSNETTPPVNVGSGPKAPDEETVPQPVSSTARKKKGGKPSVVLSGHGLLSDNTSPTKIKVPSNMSISFVGPAGSILDNPLANAIEEGRLKPEDIFVEAVSMESGDVTEIEPREIMKLYKIFGPRTVKGGKSAPNYTLTPPKSLKVSVNEQVMTVKSETTLQALFPKLQQQFPKGANVHWAACQDLPAIDRAFQIKVMSVADRFDSTKSGVKRATTSGPARKAEIKKLTAMIKGFKDL
jgi:hypothetical protein